MSDQDKAALAQQAVPEDARDGINGPFNACMFREHCRSMLAAAPAAPQAEREPVGEIIEMDDGALMPVWRDGTPPAGAKLYAQPFADLQAEREPLTDEQVFRALEDEARLLNGGTMDGLQMNPEMLAEVVNIFRIAERAHGIGKSNPPVQGSGS